MRLSRAPGKGLAGTGDCYIRWAVATAIEGPDALLFTVLDQRPVRICLLTFIRRGRMVLVGRKQCFSGRFLPTPPRPPPHADLAADYEPVVRNTAALDFRCLNGLE
jgi:hypothetical protein